MRRLHGDEPIAGIGLACGFADQSAFARQFKATVGMTPRDYRGIATGGSVQRLPAQCGAENVAMAR
jgi:AraC-like DNA-binding protein